MELLFLALLALTVFLFFAAFKWFLTDPKKPAWHYQSQTNPATGLPMYGAFDSGGNAFGSWSTWDDQWGSNSATGLPTYSAFDSGDNAFGSGSTWDGQSQTNPATGLPMCGAIDSGGNAYGSSGFSHHDD